MAKKPEKKTPEKETAKADPKKKVKVRKIIKKSYVMEDELDSLRDDFDDED